jgi:hypothetical protein
MQMENAKASKIVDLYEEVFGSYRELPACSFSFLQLPNQLVSQVRWVLHPPFHRVDILHQFGIGGKGCEKVREASETLALIFWQRRTARGRIRNSRFANVE